MPKILEITEYLVTIVAVGPHRFGLRIKLVHQCTDDNPGTILVANDYQPAGARIGSYSVDRRVANECHSLPLNGCNKSNELGSAERGVLLENSRLKSSRFVRHTIESQPIAIQSNWPA